MQRLAVLLTLLTTAALAPACGPAADAAAVTANHRAALTIEGMTCGSCSVTVKTAANKLAGLATIEIDVPAGTAAVTFDSAVVSAEQIAAKISAAGYATTVTSDEET
jgi:copper chaperone CopZ